MDHDSVDALIEQGVLQPEQVEQLQKELALDEFNTLPAQVGGKESSVTGTAGKIAVFGRYVQLEFLGQGGMARVYKAYDPSLARSVALKFVKVEDPQLAHRLLLEARSQARIEHGHVCKVYETGEVEGKPYIAMQYISGKTLKQLDESLSLRQKVELIRQVADGVHAAHKAGLIHRDLKPANILIEQRETGLEAYVMDFGLAREIQAPQLTMTGLIVGTPSYMSPEQARGHAAEIDARTDIYSIGATLYESITGRPPFEGGSTTEILMQIIEQEPVPPRKLEPSLPLDLQTIVLKCLDKNPDRRYLSARSISEDLSRFLDGDPIQATPATWMYRTNKRIRKHPVISGLLAAAFAAVVVLAGTAGVIQWQANRQAALLQEFGSKANGTEGIMRFAYLLPLHDISPERQMVQDRIDAISDRMASLGAMAQGPGHYAIGKGLMALQRYGEAKTHLELALNKYHYKQPEVAYAYGLTLTMLYQNELESVARITDKVQRELRLKEVERDFRGPALSYIRDGSQSAESPDYAEAIIGFLDKQYERAIEKSVRASRQIPWLYESRRLEAECHRRIGIDLGDSGKYREALNAFTQAEKAYQASIRKGMSDPLGYVGLCNLKSNILGVQTQTGGTVEPTYLSAKDACLNALQADPKNTEAFLALSSLHTTWAWDLWMHESGVDISTYVQEAVQTAQKAIGLQPENESTYMALGAAYYLGAVQKSERFSDPEDMIQRADQSYEKAIQINPNNAFAYHERGGLFWVQAEYTRKVGKDPRQAFDLSSGFLNKALQLKYYGAYHRLGNILSSKGAYESDVGLNPLGSLESSLQNLQRAMDVNPGHLGPLFSSGSAAMIKGEYLMMVGRSPQEAFNQAEAVYREALRIHPGLAGAFSCQAHVSWRRGEYAADIKADPSADVKAARSALDQCLAADRSNPDCHFIYSQVELVAARWKILQHTSPEPEFRNALNWLNRAPVVIGASPNAEAWITKASLTRYWAEWKVNSGQNAEKEIRLGLEAVSKVIELNPRSSEMISTRGVFCLLQARSARSVIQRKNFASQAVLAFQEGLKLNANLSHRFEHYLTEAQTLLAT